MRITGATEVEESYDARKKGKKKKKKKKTRTHHRTLSVFATGEIGGLLRRLAPKVPHLRIGTGAQTDDETVEIAVGDGDVARRVSVAHPLKKKGRKSGDRGGRRRARDGRTKRKERAPTHPVIDVGARVPRESPQRVPVLAAVSPFRGQVDGSPTVVVVRLDAVLRQRLVRNSEVRVLHLRFGERS